ncbi:Ras-related protein Rab-7L1 isoform, variant 3 [Balamuthia mandrillaris]
MSSEEVSREIIFKVLVVGELACGKTAIIRCYIHNTFSENYKSTIGVDFALKKMRYSPNLMVQLQLWDIAGQARFTNMTRVYYREAVAAFIVFDVTRRSTLDAVAKWRDDLRAIVKLPDGRDIPIVLLANKCDLGGEINAQQMDKFCKENDFIGWSVSTCLSSFSLSF